MSPLHSFDPAYRLSRARIAAGFASAEEAAKRFGWSVGTYSSDEAGARTLTEERATDYARAYGVPAAWLLQGTLPGERDECSSAERLRFLAALPFEDLSAVFIGLAGPSTAVGGADRRLRQSRIEAGFKTAKAACSRYGWKASTYGGHESGAVRIRSDVCRVYAHAFGVNPEWLLKGDYFKGHRFSAGPLPSPSEVARLQRSLLKPSLSKRQGRRKAIHFVEFGGPVGAGSADGGAGTNAKTAGPVFRQPSELVLAVASAVPADAPFGVGDRVWIDASGDSAHAPRYLAVADGERGVRVVDAGTSTDRHVIGGVIGFLFGGSGSEDGSGQPVTTSVLNTR